MLPNLYQCSTWSKSWIRDNSRIMLKILSSSFLIILQQKRNHLYMINLRYSVQLFFFRYLDFPSLIALSSSHPSLAWLWPDFYDFTVSRNMLKAKDAADVVLMNNFLADFPVEEVNSCNILYTCIRNVPNKMNPLKIGTLSHCLWAGEAGGDLEGRGDQTEATQRQASVQGGLRKTLIPMPSSQFRRTQNPNL